LFAFLLVDAFVVPDLAEDVGEAGVVAVVAAKF
jgi:hypothetical protein